MKLSKFALLGAFAFAVMTGSVSADELQQPVLEPIAYTLQDAADSPSDDGTWSLFKRDGEGLEISGWTQVGYHDGSDGLFNSQDNAKSVGVEQLWFAFDKASDADAEGFGLGYHFDLTYGRHSENTNAFGNPNAGAAGDWDTEEDDWAMPQLYLTGHLGDWDITLGKFYTIVGYEVVQANGNFFYSHAKTMNNSEPFTHTGVLASKTTETGLDLTVGWTAGWDTGFDSNGSNGIIGVGKSLGDNIGLNYGKLILFVFNNLILQELTGQNSLIGAAVEIVGCDGIAGGLSNLGIDEDDIYDACVGAVTLLMLPLESYLLGLETDSLVKLSGTAEMRDEDSDLIVDTIIDGVWDGQIIYNGASTSPFSGTWEAIRVEGQ